MIQPQNKPIPLMDGTLGMTGSHQAPKAPEKTADTEAWQPFDCCFFKKKNETSNVGKSAMMSYGHDGYNSVMNGSQCFWVIIKSMCYLYIHQNNPPIRLLLWRHQQPPRNLLRWVSVLCKFVTTNTHTHIYTFTLVYIYIYIILQLKFTVFFCEEW